MEWNCKIGIKLVTVIMWTAIILNILGCGEDSIISSNNSQSYASFERSISWSPNNLMLAYISNSAIIIKNALNGDVKALTGTGLYEQPTWSPDSSNIAFTSATYDDLRAQIFTKKSDGTEVAKKFSKEVFAYYHPRWSPDGKRIAFHCYQKGTMNIYIKNSDEDSTGAETAVTIAPNMDQNAEWSPDGTKLAFESKRAGNYDIWIADTNGTAAPVQLNTDTSADTVPLWSYDGSRILFQSDRYDLIGVWAMNADGSGDAIHVSQGFAKAEKPSWSPNGKWISFISSSIAYARKSDGTGDPVKIEDALEAWWSPDGTKMALIGLDRGEYRVKIINVPPDIK
jgi:Tol biopolymer transport system component